MLGGSLGEILKAYAKEVIRQRPADIYEFSARYFAQLDQQEDQYLDSGAGPLLFTPSPPPSRASTLFLSLFLACSR